MALILEGHWENVKMLKEKWAQSGDILGNTRRMAGAPFVDVFKMNVYAGDVVEAEALEQTPLSEMSKASYGRQQETDNLTPLLFKLVKPVATVQAHLPFPVRFKWQSHIFYHEKPFNRKKDILPSCHYRTAELLRQGPYRQ